jgi:hypothetical protein
LTVPVAAIFANMERSSHSFKFVGIRGQWITIVVRRGVRLDQYQLEPDRISSVRQASDICVVADHRGGFVEFVPASVGLKAFKRLFDFVCGSTGGVGRRETWTVWFGHRHSDVTVRCVDEASCRCRPPGLASRESIGPAGNKRDQIPSTHKVACVHLVLLMPFAADRRFERSNLAAFLPIKQPIESCGRPSARGRPGPVTDQVGSWPAGAAACGR